MKVQMAVSISSTEGWAYRPGQIVDVAEGFAKALLSDGRAVAVEEETKKK